MATAADTLRAIEARAERAIVQELRLMMQEIFGLRTHLVLEDRAHADGLLLKLDRLECGQAIAPSNGTDDQPFLMPSLSVTVYETRVSKAYRVFFYDRDYGDLEDVVTVGTFDAGVQLVRNRLAPEGDYVIDAAWTQHQGEMTVSTPSGTVLARVEVEDGHAPIAQPNVRDACCALQAGEVTGIKQLFGPMLEAA